MSSTSTTSPYQAKQSAIVSALPSLEPFYQRLAVAKHSAKRTPSVLSAQISLSFLQPLLEGSKHLSYDMKDDPINQSQHRDLFWDVDYVYSKFYDGDFEAWLKAIRAKNRKAMENPRGRKLR